MFDLSDEEVEEYFSDFSASLNECCEKLRELEKNVSFPAVRVVTHTLVGFCDNMGAIDVADKARELNTAAKAENVESCKVHIREILALHELYLQ